MTENQEKPIKGTAPVPDTEFTLSAQEFVQLQRISKGVERLILPFTDFLNAVQILEQKFIAEGKLVFFYEEDIEYSKTDSGEYELDRIGNKIPKGLKADFFTKVKIGNN